MKIFVKRMLELLPGLNFLMINKNKILKKKSVIILFLYILSEPFQNTFKLFVKTIFFMLLFSLSFQQILICKSMFKTIRYLNSLKW